MLDLENLKYADLQKLAKSYGLKANQKASVLREELLKIFATTSHGVESGASAVAANNEVAPQLHLSVPEPCVSTGDGGVSSTSEPTAGDVAIASELVEDYDEDKENRPLSCAPINAQETDRETSVAIHVEQPGMWSPIIPLASSPADLLAHDSVLIDLSIGDSAIDANNGFGPRASSVAEENNNAGIDVARSSSVSISREAEFLSISVAASAEPVMPASSKPGCDAAVHRLRRRTYDKNDVDDVSDCASIPQQQDDVCASLCSPVNFIDGSQPSALLTRREKSCSDWNKDNENRSMAQDANDVMDGCTSIVTLPGQDVLESSTAIEHLAGTDAADRVLLSSMKHDMTDDEMKASLLAALQKRADERQAEIAERVAKARTDRGTSGKTGCGNTAAGRGRRPAGQGKTPDWSRIHALNFAKMESIESYVAKKRLKLEEANRVLGLSSPALSSSTSSTRAISARPQGAATKDTSYSSIAAASASSTALFGPAVADACEGKTLQLQPSDTGIATKRPEYKQGGARVVKPIRGAGGTSAAVSRLMCRAPGGAAPSAARHGLVHRPARLPAASPPLKHIAFGTCTPLKPAINNDRGPSAISLKNSSIVTEQQHPSTVTSSKKDTGSGLSEQATKSVRGSNVLNSTFTIARSTTFDVQSSLAKKTAWQPHAGPVRPADAYKKPVLKTRDHRRAELLASKKDKRMDSVMQRRLLDN